MFARRSPALAVVLCSALAVVTTTVSAAEPAPDAAVTLPSQDLRWAAFYPLGDVDLDGRADFVYVYSAWANGLDQVSGAVGLTQGGTQQAWATQGDGWHGWVSDLDGNGIHDVASVDPTTSGEATGAGALVGGALTGQFASAGPLRVQDGVALKEAGTLAYGYATEYTLAYAYPAVAYAIAEDYRQAGTSSSVMGAGQVFSQEYRSHAAYAYAGSLVATQVFAVDDDATFTTADANGAVMARLDISGPTVEPIVAHPGSFASQDGFGVAAVWWEDTPYAYAYPATSGSVIVSSHVAVSMGDGIAWEVERPPSLVQATTLLPVLDVDGDGADDVQYIEERLDLAAGTPSRVAQTFLYSGPTGDLLHEGPTTSSAVAYFPFGSRDHPAGGRLLRMEYDYDDYAWAILPRFDAEADWSVPASGSVPINALYEPYAPRQFTDLTGDGQVDLVLGEWSNDDLSMQAFDGRDGTLLWAADVADALWAMPLVAGSQTDLLVAQATGNPEAYDDDAPESATAGFTVLDGAMGAVAWKQVLRAPEATPVDSEGRFYLSARGLGDVDGDGQPDFGITLEERQTREDDGREARYYRSSPYLFGSVSRLPLAGGAPGNATAADGDLSPLLPPPVVPNGEGEAESGKDTPGAPLGFLLAALAAVAVASRRRLH